MMQRQGSTEKEGKNKKKEELLKLLLLLQSSYLELSTRNN